jgi:hypothetical protein
MVTPGKHKLLKNIGLRFTDAVDRRKKDRGV